MMRKALFAILTSFVLGVIGLLHAPQAQAQIYVANSFGNNIPTFPNNANGDIVPTTNIQGAVNTTLESPADVAVDANFIYVANFFNDSIDVFHIGDTGDVAPTRSIQGAINTTLNRPSGVAVDANFIYVANSNHDSIDVFPIGAAGDVAPTRSIQGAVNTTLDDPRGVAVDANFIYVGNSGNNSIDVFPIGAAGDVAPTRSIQGAVNTTLDDPRGVAVDANFIYVANSNHDSIDVFPIGAAGDVAPTRSIQGAVNTTLDDPRGVAVDANFIYVGNFRKDSIDVFLIDDNGDVAPTRTIRGPATTLDGPEGVAVTALQPPCVDIEKLVSVDGGTTFVDADDCVAAPVTGIDAEYKLVVTNCGSLTLNNVTVTDPDLGINVNIGPLAPGESRMDTISAPGICPGGPEIVNTATVTTDEGVTDSDSTCVRCIPQQVPALTGWGISVLALGLLGSALRVMQSRNRM